jgi:indole-3-glycerol phosphate synthase/phosphoribosylanthranilate isomerase
VADVSTPNPGGVLGEIVARKRDDVAARLAGQSLEVLRAQAEPTTRSLADALARPGVRFIMEMKRTSPSRGDSAGHEPEAVAHAYAGIADAMSVLTDGPYFGGSFEDLAAARRAFDGPILCKDFTVDPRQIPEARIHGADAVLVMLSVLHDDEAAACIAEAGRLGMGALVEVHDEGELDRAMRLGAAIIGINNRDLKTLKTDLAVTERLAPMVPAGPVLLSESGIATRSDVERLSPLVDGFLVGSSLMAEPDIAGAARRLVFGRVKICGLTRPEDAAAARSEGASYGGLIFVDGSPRKLGDTQAKALADRARAAGLPLVGVFRDAPVETVIEAANAYGLAAVQLHGSEDSAYAMHVKLSVPADCEIWTTVPVGDDEPALALRGGRPLFDTRVGGQVGGTGKLFDWDRVRGHPEISRAIIAGGLGPETVAAAAGLGAWALDVNSSVEDAPGIKSATKLRALFAALRPAGRGEERC